MNLKPSQVITGCSRCGGFKPIVKINENVKPPQFLCEGCSKEQFEEDRAWFCKPTDVY
jgi:hypothetical protein